MTKNTILFIIGSLFELISLAQEKTIEFHSFSEALKYREECKILRLDEKHLNVKDSIDLLKFLPNIVELYLPDNYFKRIPKVIFKLKYLQVLDLTKSSLKKIPKKINRLAHLNSLVLFDNDIKFIPGYLANNQELGHIDLAWNKLEKISYRIGELKSLEELILYLGTTEKITLPESIANCQHLKYLNLAGFSFSQFPIQLTRITSLEFLDFSACGLDSMPSEIGNLINLKEFLIQVNDLTALPKELQKLKSLKELWMSGNQIQKEEIDLLCKNLPNCMISSDFGYCNKIE